MNTRASTKRTADGLYQGMVKDGARVVAVCPHLHHNRDNGNLVRWPQRIYLHSAWECAQKYIKTGQWPQGVA